eukprot:gnl/MRDRNA2_/MRDRNA2_204153_c0_seq1.p1 gnl/MRDRNA2_/MRDRNA2_204153_c0~~gnl/MRDRNA2_/MRDRNA2_204153_c0_seq1.p1  ORF type:complete len:197 (+),score=32.96 gnl/MRDRNA2_/MRDRNA2_204153_c0_seq1:104-694(+)
MEIEADLEKMSWKNFLRREFSMQDHAHYKNERASDATINLLLFYRGTIHLKIKKYVFLLPSGNEGKNEYDVNHDKLEDGSHDFGMETSKVKKPFDSHLEQDRIRATLDLIEKIVKMYRQGDLVQRLTNREIKWIFDAGTFWAYVRTFDVQEKAYVWMGKIVNAISAQIVQLEAEDFEKFGDEEIVSCIYSQISLDV